MRSDLNGVMPPLTSIKFTEILKNEMRWTKDLRDNLEAYDDWYDDWCIKHFEWNKWYEKLKF